MADTKKCYPVKQFPLHAGGGKNGGGKGQMATPSPATQKSMNGGVTEKSTRHKVHQY